MPLPGAPRSPPPLRCDGAIRGVEKAQGEVNRIRGEIDSTQRWFNSLPRVALPNKPSQVREAAGFAAKMRGA